MRFRFVWRICSMLAKVEELLKTKRFTFGDVVGLALIACGIASLPTATRRSSPSSYTSWPWLVAPNPLALSQS
jgi:hypothetical protein